MDSEVYQKLVAFRAEQARNSRRELFRVFLNETITALATILPKTHEELKTIKGLGPKKIAEFGDAILAITSDGTVVQEVALDEGQQDERVFTVSKFLDHINAFLVAQNVTVRGEISKVTLHETGVYFDLKDTEQEKALIHCYVSPPIYRALGITLEEGLEVKIGGYPRMYKPRGDMSFQVESIELFGEGSLKRAYEQLKKKLEEEGLFDRKRPIPSCIHTIALITSKTGAVIGDFRNNLEQLGYQVMVYDTRVEGAQAVEGICRGIRQVHRLKTPPDILVVIRGGGSWEDLQAFNNELVARTIFGSKIPTICGIGHDRDVPIASLVADVSCSTPTATAHTINASWHALQRSLPVLQEQLFAEYRHVIQNQRAQVGSFADRLFGEFNRILLAYSHLSQRLRTVLEQQLNRLTSRLDARAKYLAAVNPLRTLRLGYSILFDENHHVIKDINSVKQGERVTTRLQDGEIISKVEDVQKKKNNE